MYECMPGAGALNGLQQFNQDQGRTSYSDSGTTWYWMDTTSVKIELCVK
jgi:hypothetical protein